jgi:hypothetical protein
VIRLARSLDALTSGANGLLILGDFYGDLLYPYDLPPEVAPYNLDRPVDPLLENGSTTFLLVSNFIGAVGDQLDPDHNGVLDTTPWSLVVDSVGWSDGTAGDDVYSAALLSQSARPTARPAGPPPPAPRSPPPGSTRTC